MKSDSRQGGCFEYVVQDSLSEADILSGLYNVVPPTPTIVWSMQEEFCAYMLNEWKKKPKS